MVEEKRAANASWLEEIRLVVSLPSSFWLSDWILSAGSLAQVGVFDRSFFLVGFVLVSWSVVEGVLDELYLFLELLKPLCGEGGRSFSMLN